MLTNIPNPKLKLQMIGMKAGYYSRCTEGREMTPINLDEIERLAKRLKKRSVNRYVFEVQGAEDFPDEDCHEAAKQLTALIARIRELEADNTELQRVFDVTWDAEQRAIKLWQAAHPGNDLLWPDKGKMTLWLLDRTAELEAALPTFEDVRGIAPDATGDLSSEEFVRNIRDEWT